MKYWLVCYINLLLFNLIQISRKKGSSATGMYTLQRKYQFFEHILVVCLIADNYILFLFKGCVDVLLGSQIFW